MSSSLSGFMDGTTGNVYIISFLLTAKPYSFSCCWIHIRYCHGLEWRYLGYYRSFASLKQATLILCSGWLRFQEAPADALFKCWCSYFLKKLGLMVIVKNRLKIGIHWQLRWPSPKTIFAATKQTVLRRRWYANCKRGGSIALQFLAAFRLQKLEKRTGRKVNILQRKWSKPI